MVTVWLANRAPIESVVRHDIPTFRLRYRMLHLDREMTVPAWFSVILFAVNAGLAGLVAWVRRQRREGDVGAWVVLALVFVSLSIDELVAIHEVLPDRVRAVLGDYAVGPLYYAWYLPVVAFFGAIGLWLIPAWLRLPARTRWGMMASLGIFLLGAVGFEATMGWVMEARGAEDPPLQGGPWGLVFLVMAEELTELVGLSVLTCVLFAYLRPQVRLQIGDPVHTQ